MYSQIFSKCFFVLLVLGRPECSSSSSDTQLSWKCECHLEIAIWLKECSPNAPQTISRDSVADLPSVMQNLMQPQFSILPSIADKMKHDIEKALL
jgi:hypothetical protein